MFCERMGYIGNGAIPGARGVLPPSADWTAIRNFAVARGMSIPPGTGKIFFHYRYPRTGATHEARFWGGVGSNRGKLYDFTGWKATGKIVFIPEIPSSAIQVTRETPAPGVPPRYTYAPPGVAVPGIPGIVQRIASALIPGAPSAPPYVPGAAPAYVPAKTFLQTGTGMATVALGVVGVMGLGWALLKYT